MPNQPQKSQSLTGYCHSDYHVADEDGNGWHRTRKEISVIEEEPALTF